MREESDQHERDEEKLIKIAKERFKLAQEAEQDVRTLALDDLRFSAGDQWPSEMKAERAQDGRPCLVINRVPQFIRQITNQQRQSRPGMKVSPVDDHADVDTAEVIQGLIRHIEYNSNADVAYNTAFESAVRHGFGYYRIVTDYVDPWSFDQEILIKRVRNPFSVYMDPASKEIDGSDMNWCFVFEEVTKDQFKDDYEESELSKMQDWTAIGDQVNDWVNTETVRVAEYFYKDYEERTLLLLSDGVVIDKAKFSDGNLPMGVSIVNERVAQVPIIKWCKINGMEILEEGVWPGQWIPIIPVFGSELDINGKRYLEGIVRHAKDSQRMYNYWASTETETISLAPRAPYIAAEGQIPREYEGQWKTANKKNHAYLVYKPTALNGQPLPPPQRNVFETPVQAITNARMQASEDMKATTGIYDAGLGARSNETSGVGIQRRKEQGETSNYHFLDNFFISMRHGGRIIVDILPKIYDAPRTARIIGIDGREEMVKLNQVFKVGANEKHYNLSAGKYDVVMDTGPSYATRRQEALASMMDLTRNYPQMAQVAGDLLVKNMDWPGANDIAKRLEKTLPPGILEDKNKPQLPPEVQAQMQQMQTLIGQLTEQLNAASDDIKTKRVELESKERIEFAKLDVELKKEFAKLHSQESIAALKAEMQDIQSRLNLLNFNEPLNFNGTGSDQSVSYQDQQPQFPTGGASPGQFMGE